VQTLDYYPYGSTRISVATSTNERRKYIGQFSDDSTLSYLNARYYDSARAQFLSEDPVFLGDPKLQDTQNPQSLNSYSYANDNPVINKDPSGRCGVACLVLGALLVPEPVGDPVFSQNGSISSTPQQVGINAGGFAGQMLSGSGEMGLIREAQPETAARLIESIGVNGSINEVTSLPDRIPKGAAIGTAILTIGTIAVLTNGVNGWDDSPKNLDLLMALLGIKSPMQGNATRSADTNNGPRLSGSSVIPGAYMSRGGTQSYQAAGAPFSGTLGLPSFVASAASKGYGSSGSTYTVSIAH
jgi:RHS repeat-associated protein